MDDGLRNMLYRLDNGDENDLRKRVANLEQVIATLLGNSETDPVTLQGVDDRGILRTVSDNVDLQQNIGTADGLQINWWLPMTLADDSLSYITCGALVTISGVKYLYVGGSFDRIGGIAAANIARYNFGTRQWEAVNGGVNLGVTAIAFSPAGVLHIGGSFTNAGGDALADYIAKDNGGSWVNVNGGVNNIVWEITFSPNGTLYIGGYFTDAGGDTLADYIAKDNGGSWVNVNGGVNSGVDKIEFSPAGVLHIGGVFTNAGGDALADYIAKDNGGSWVNVNGGVSSQVWEIAFSPDGTLHIGGAFTNAGGDALADYIAKDGGGSWVNVNGGVNNQVRKITFSSSGVLYIGGLFTDAGGISEADAIAYSDGTNWRALSNGGGMLGGVNVYVYDILIDDNNTIYAAGDFDTAGTIKTASIAAYVSPLADALDMVAGLFEQYQTREVDRPVFASWTPTFTNLTVGNGTLDCSYVKKGKLVVATIHLTFGSTTSITGTVVRCTIPTGTMPSRAYMPLGNTQCLDTSAGTIFAGNIQPALSDPTTQVNFRSFGISASSVVTQNITSTAPFTWATGDILAAMFTYEVA
jgi:hypothetical protein